MSSNNALFSCIVPVYNTDIRLLKRCLDSILKQSIADVELIIIDDGSNEYTARFCDEYKKQSEKVKVLHQPNMGLACARNAGISAASGRWLVHIDSDDHIDLNMLEHIARIAFENSDIILFGYKTIAKNAIKSRLLINKGVLKYPYYAIRSEAIFSVLTVGRKFRDIALNTTWAKAFRREFVQQAGLMFQEELWRAQDAIYNLYAFYAAKRITYIDSAPYNYNIDNESLSRGYNPKTYEQITKTALACLEFANNHKDIPKIEKAAQAFIRRCFKSILTNDLINETNPQNKHERETRFKEMLRREPYRSAFKEIGLSCLSLNLNTIELSLIKYRLFSGLIISRRLRVLMKTIFRR